MAVGSKGQAYHTKQVHYLGPVAFTEADEGGGAITIGILPPGAVVLRAGIVVTTAFNGTTPIADMGTSDDADGWATDISTATAGNIVADTTNASDDLYATQDVTATVTVSATGNDSTAGAGYAYVEYIVADPAIASTA